MNNNERYKRIKKHGRRFDSSMPTDDDLGPLSQLPGIWQSKGRGWNMIALPFATPPGGGFNYRVLMNQYNERLRFSLVDKGVPNRGIRRNGSTSVADQFLVALDYQQSIVQIAADDFPVSGLAGNPKLPIHHEPGLWLNMLNEQTNDLDVARLATIPHGDSVLALGKSEEQSGGPTIPKLNGLPIGVNQDVNANPYLRPYKQFVDQPFKGVETDPNFPGFNPVDLNNLLELANVGVDIVKTTKLEVDSTIESGGIVNIPFIVKQANAATMKSTFWIQELAKKDKRGAPKLRLQYSQIVILDFFDRIDGHPGLIRWPHVSINTLEKKQRRSPSYNRHDITDSGDLDDFDDSDDNDD